MENLIPCYGKMAKLASMVWNFFGKLLPWRGKMAKVGSMAWKIFWATTLPAEGGAGWKGKRKEGGTAAARPNEDGGRT